MIAFHSLGLGVGTQNSNGKWLEVYFPSPVLNPSENLVNAIRDVLHLIDGDGTIALSQNQTKAIRDSLLEAGEKEQAAIANSLSTSEKPLVLVLVERDDTLRSVPEAYLKLHLISHRLVRPHGLVLDGLFGILPNVAWTNKGAIDLEELPQRQFDARVKGETLSVECVDKFPKMTDYVVPKGVRIADTARVRLGAYLGEGTTIMHEGFVNFNAGTEGPNMVEGRISAGVFVGAGSDLGGGCSTMGTLSGGGSIIISVGKECLIGANAGVGIPLGDRCTVEAGLYVTAGTRVILLDDQHKPAGEAKARDLAGKDDLLFRRNSTSGAVECLTNRSAIALNEALHVHN